MTFHVRRRVGELSSRLAADVAQIEDTVVSALPQFLRQSAMLVGSIALIAFTSLRLTAVMLSVFPVLIGIAVVFGRLIRRNSKDAQDRLADGNVVVEETLQGIATVKAFANEDYEKDRYRRALDHFLDRVLRAQVPRRLLRFHHLRPVRGRGAGAVVRLPHGTGRPDDAGGPGELHAIHHVRRRGDGVVCRPVRPAATHPRRHPARSGTTRRENGGRNGTTAVRGCRPAARRRGFRERRFPLSVAARGGGAARRVPGGACGPTRGPGRAERGRQIDAGVATVALLRAGARPHPHRRPRRPRLRLATNCAGQMALVPQDVLLFGGTIAREHRLRPAGRDARPR